MIILEKYLVQTHLDKTVDMLSYLRMQSNVNSIRYLYSPVAHFTVELVQFCLHVVLCYVKYIIREMAAIVVARQITHVIRKTLYVPLPGVQNSSTQPYITCTFTLLIESKFKKKKTLPEK